MKPSRTFILAFTALLAFALVTTLMGVRTHAQPEASGAEKQVSRNDQISRISWELFLTGCINQSAEIEKWADSQVQLIKAEVKDEQAFQGMWKNLGYPVPDKLVNMWGVVSVPTWLYQHENKGCTVTTNAHIPPEKLKSFFKSVADGYEKGSGKSTDLQEKESGDTFITLLIFDPKGQGNRAHLLARSFGNDREGIKTILYFVRSENRLNI